MQRKLWQPTERNVSFPEGQCMCWTPNPASELPFKSCWTGMIHVPTSTCCYLSALPFCCRRWRCPPGWGSRDGWKVRRPRRDGFGMFGMDLQFCDLNVLFKQWRHIYMYIYKLFNRFQDMFIGWGEGKGEGETSEERVHDIVWIFFFSAITISMTMSY